MNLESLVDEEWDKGTGGSWYAGLATILTMGMMAVIAAGVGWLEDLEETDIGTGEGKGC